MKKINVIFKLLSIIIEIIVGVKQMMNGIPVADFIISLSLIVIVFIPDILRRIGVKITPTIELIYLIFVFFAITLGSVLDFYQTFYFYDNAIHFLSGILTSFIGIFILVKAGKYSEKNVLFNCIVIIFTVMAIASFWEIFEFTSDIILRGDVQNVLTTGVDDTMTDMISALLGTLLICIYYLYEKAKKGKSLIKRFITEIR